MDGLFTLEQGDDGIAVIRLDVAGERHNIIRRDLLDELNACFDELADDAGLRGVIVASAKPDSFIAGADVRMLADCASAVEATDLARSGQAFCDRVAGFPVPVIAAIDGTCLGGGLEFALACHGRIAADSEATRLGLPEVRLGLLPGSGGTQRLPRLIGVQRALELMLTGRQLHPPQALRLGLVDEVVPASILLDVARRRIEGSARTREKPHLPWYRHFLESTALGRQLLFNLARRQLRTRTGDNYPAPRAIIDCVDYGLIKGLTVGLQFEAERFGELSQTPEARALLYLYFATTALKKDTGTEQGIRSRPIERIGVLGAGLMGAGIAAVSTRADLHVRLKDTDPAGLQRGLRHVRQQIDRALKRRSITPFEADRQRRRVTPTTDWSGFGRLDLVIEAVFEDLDLKQRMVTEVERHCRPDTIFASNTSSLPIASIAANAERPQNVLGMHYFSPVEKMPLLEVVATERTDPEAVATAMALGRRQGKTVITVRDGAGFYVNRILAPYINEAGWLLLEGVPVEAVDRALVRFGFPVGPFTLLDEVGFEVVAKVAPVLLDAFGERMLAPPLIERLLDEGYRGRKNRRGFYRYDRRLRLRRKAVDRTVYRILGVQPGAAPAPDAIAERCVLPMLNEAARCLDEGIIRSARDGDIGAVFGIGFPPFRGGPFHYLEQLGDAHVSERLQALERRHGARFTPAAALVSV